MPGFSLWVESEHKFAVSVFSDRGSGQSDQVIGVIGGGREQGTDTTSDVGNLQIDGVKSITRPVQRQARAELKRSAGIDRNRRKVLCVHSNSEGVNTRKFILRLSTENNVGPNRPWRRSSTAAARSWSYSLEILIGIP